jgi:hypothetical protein
MRTEHEEEDIWRDTLYWEKGRRRERVARLFELRLQVMGGCGCGCCGGENRIANRNGLEEVGVEE